MNENEQNNKLNDIDERAKLRIIKYLAPPLELPKAEPNQKNITYFGKTTYSTYIQDKRFVFGIKNKDRNQHVYVIGKSGVGKSKFLESIIRQDISNDKAVVVIDPHGDLIDDLLKFIPQKRHEDVCIIDPSDTNYPIAFNPFSDVSEQFKNRVAQDLIEVLKRQFGETWSAKIEHVFRFTLLALLDYPKSNFQNIIDILTDKNFRQEVIEYINNDFVKRFWAVEFSGWSQKFDSEAITPLVNKIGGFLADPLINNIFTQKENKINLFKLMNENKIILINLSKGKLGEENASFFGSIFLTKIKQAGMERAFLPKEKRNEVYLYIDEFQNIVTNTFESMLSESRKYGFAMTLAHQYLSQIPDNILHAIFGNVSTVISFRISGQDAFKLKEEFAPLLESKDLMNLGKREFYIKTIIDGETYNPFSAETLFVPEHNETADIRNAEKIVQLSRKQYSNKINNKKTNSKSTKKKLKKKLKLEKDESVDVEPII